MQGNKLHSKNSLNNYQEAFDFNEFCQQQLEQMALKIPLVAARFLYQNTNQSQPQSIEFNRQKLSCQAIDYHRLRLEASRLNELPPFTLSEIEIEDNLKAIIYPFNNRSHNLEYLLLFTYECLSQSQKQWINQQVVLLINFLNIFKEYQRQKAENQLLEQVIQRSEHQLRHSIALISLYAENLCLALSDSSQLEQVQIIRETVNHLSSDLKNLLKCGQQEKLRITTYDLAAIIGDSIRGYKPWVEEKKLCINYPDTPAIIAIDSQQIKYVFDNILSNAIHFSPQGSKITCNWQVFQQEILVEISDQGP